MTTHSKKICFYSILAVLLALVAVGIWIYSNYPQIESLKSLYPHVIYKGNKEPFKIELKTSRPANWVSYEQVSKKALAAIIVSEDSAFFAHEGVDTDELKNALQTDLEAGKFKRGASTIPMQVVKNIFLSQEKSLLRKLKELIIAIDLDRKLSKKKILELYINIVELGEGIFGIERASQYYFHKPASLLDAKEGAFLAMLLPSPKRYSVSFRQKSLTPYAQKTINSILDKLVKNGTLSLEEREIFSDQPYSFESIESSP